MNNPYLWNGTPQLTLKRRMVVLTAASANYTVPSDALWIETELFAAGGNGAAAAALSRGGGGGGASGVAEGTWTVTPGQVIPYQIAQTNATAKTWFATDLTLFATSGATAGSDAAGAGGTFGGSLINGLVSFFGHDGGDGQPSNVGLLSLGILILGAQGGTGGTNKRGGGGRGGFSGGAGFAGKAYGGGGGGGALSSINAGAGATGGPGRIVVWEYYYG